LPVAHEFMSDSQLPVKMVERTGIAPPAAGAATAGVATILWQNLDALINAIKTESGFLEKVLN
jgi:hypothetical protein